MIQCSATTELIADPSEDYGFRYARLRAKDRHKLTEARIALNRQDRHKDRQSPETKPFMAIDGEGGGKNEHGQQNYLLLSACTTTSVPYVLFNDNERLTTIDCLEFILALPSDVIIVGFFFDYDVTQILRDLPTDRLARLLGDHAVGRGLSPWTEWKGYLLQYVPKQFLRVMRKDVKGSSRTVNETGGFFQKPFTAVIKEWQVCDDTTLKMIEDQKALRPEFETITPEIMNYCEQECRLLAEVMTRLRDRFITGTEAVSHLGELSMVPRAWRGAGYVAARLLESTGTPKTQELPSVPGKLGNMMVEAYYGGHFEISRTGYINSTVYEYDINSAYPAAMPSLPCPKHTVWERVSKPAPGRLFIADIKFSHPKSCLWAGFPFRSAFGHLSWPLSGQGIYWSPEIEAAEKIGASIQFIDVWQSVKCCDCQPYSWVEPLYEFRKSLGKGTEGYPIKLGLNAMYGKLAQRKGAQLYHNLIHAGLITAITRSKLLSAVAMDPEAILMLATDGVYSLRPLPLETGPKLGQWEAKEHGSMFIVQPGLYWFPDSATSHKTRGIPKSVVQENADRFLKGWEEFSKVGWLFPEIPGCDKKYNVALPLNNFIGIRLALSRNKPDTAGCWTVTRKSMSFDWTNKRGPGVWSKDRSYIQHSPIVGDVNLRSAPYDPKKLTDIEDQNIELEGMPDKLEMVER